MMVGKYLHGLRNGKGKEYYYDGNLMFEVEYLYEKKWNGKIYDNSNKITIICIFIPE